MLGPASQIRRAFCIDGGGPRLELADITRVEPGLGHRGELRLEPGGLARGRQAILGLQERRVRAPRRVCRVEAVLDQAGRHLVPLRLSGSHPPWPLPELFDGNGERQLERLGADRKEHLKRRVAELAGLDEAGPGNAQAREIRRELRVVPERTGYRLVFRDAVAKDDARRRHAVRPLAGRPDRMAGALLYPCLRDGRQRGRPHRTGGRENGQKHDGGHGSHGHTPPTTTYHPRGVFVSPAGYLFRCLSNQARYRSSRSRW